MTKIRTPRFSDLPGQLCSDFESAQANINVDRQAAATLIKRHQDTVEVATKALQKADEAVNQAAAECAKLRGEIETIERSLQADVDAAQVAYDLALSKGEGVRDAAAALFAAKQRREGGNAQIGGLRIVLATSDEITAKASADAEAARGELARVEQELAAAELAAADIDADEGQLIALAAHLVVRRLDGRRANSQGQRWGWDSLAFWFSDVRRAPRWNTQLSFGGQDRKGPVMFSGPWLNTLVTEACA